MAERGPAIELVHGDGSRSRYEADYALGFVLVSARGERIRAAPTDLEAAVRRHMWGMAFDAGRVSQTRNSSSATPGDA